MKPTRPWGAVAIYLGVAISCGLGLVPRAPLLSRLTHLPAALVTVCIVAGLLAPSLFMLAMRLRVLFAITALAVAVSTSAVVFPIVERRTQLERQGTDLPDCIIAGAAQLAHARWPYDRRLLWTQHPMSCGPGWIALQAPVTVVFGYAANLAVLWILAVVLVARGLGWRIAAAWSALLLLSPGFWWLFGIGADLATFGLVLTGILALTQARIPLRASAAVLLSLAAQCRLPFILLPSLLVARLGQRFALAASGLASATYLGFALYDPSRFVSDGPLHVVSKLLGLHVFAITRTQLFTQLALGLCLLMALGFFVGQRLAATPLALVYVLLVLGLPAMSNLWTVFQQHDSIISALHNWEGAAWLAGCVPVAALNLVLTIESSANARVAPRLERPHYEPTAHGSDVQVTSRV